MAAPIISISSDSSEESVGSHAPRVILFGTVPAIIMVIPEVPSVPADPIVASEVGAVSVISPTRVLDLVDYSSFSDSDPSEDSLPVAPSYKFSLAPFVASPRIPRRPAILVRPGEAIPFGRPCRTHLNGLHKLLNVRKRVGPFSAHSTSSSSSSDSSSNISSGSSLVSLSDSSSVHSLGQSHSGPSTRVASPRLVDPPSSPYLSSERSLDSSSPSAGPSRKRCRSPTTLVSSSNHVSRSITPALADLPPRKRFRDSYSSEVSREEHIEMGIADVETVVNLGISEGVGAHTEDGIDLGVEVATSDIREDEEEFEAEARDAPDLEGTLYDISHYMSEVPLDRIIEFETAQRQLEVGQLEASRERVGLADRVRSLGQENLRVRALLCIERDRVDSLRRHMVLSQKEFLQNMTITRSGMTPKAIEELVNRRVEEALAAYEVTRAANALEAESQIQNGNDGDNRNGGNGNRGNGNGGNGNPNENEKGDRLVAREYTYQDFMKWQPLNFKGTKGVVGLIRWFEKMEIVFHISNCPKKYQVKYANCTLLNNALTWWNSHKRTVGTDAAFAMSGKELMKLIAEVYCPRNEIQKMESELWNLTVKNNDLAAYTHRFQELTMLCTKMVPEEEDRVERFIGGLLDNIRGNVIAAEPIRLQDAVRIANN
ncbi:putative reverse transcriptase domain-containing protein [Tanacetum coccineum]|uniref:Reverse transcriptase domain-containing protein n=1 Tax=Tanacetum coccineum TaxID=301880 RepID=A0ABQ5J5G1_9ASTR